MVIVMNANGNHASQSELIEKHTETVDWLSSSILWKSELQNFQNMLEERALHTFSKAGKVDADHFQLMILHYLSEIEKLRGKLRHHETILGKLLESNDVSPNQGGEEHEYLMNLLESFSKTYKQFRKEFFQFTLKPTG
jgi:hypothetical protein